MTWAVAELQAQCDELAYGLRTIGTAFASGAGADITLVTLEEQTVVVSLDERGVRCAIDSASVAYDSVDSMLLNTSPRFKEAFNRKLADMLAVVAREREAEEESEAEEAYDG